MPIYEYQCQKCGEKFEKLMFKQEDVRCPKCRSQKARKVPSSFVAKDCGGSKGSCESCSGGSCSCCG